MEKDKEKDDVASLCNRAGVQPSNYRRFDQPRKPAEHSPAVEATTPDADLVPAAAVETPEPAVEEVAASAAEPPAPAETTSGDDVTEVLLTLPVRETPEHAVTPESTEGFLTRALHSPVIGLVPRVREKQTFGESLTSSRQPSRLVLDNFFMRPPANSRTASAGRTTAPLIPVVGAVGGAGATTVVANLARALSLSGGSVLAVEAAEHSLLHYYFGVVTSDAGQMLAIQDPQGRVDPLYLMEIARPDAAGSAVLWQNVERMGTTVQHMLAGLSPTWLAAFGPRLWQDERALIVLTPELRAIAGAVRLQDYLAQEESTRRVTPFFLLNRFDEQISLHCTIRGRLREMLGESLLPFEIPETTEIPEALATGRTIVDANGDAPASQAFFRLAEWYRGSEIATGSGRTSRGFRSA